MDPNAYYPPSSPYHLAEPLATDDYYELRSSVLDILHGARQGEKFGAIAVRPISINPDSPDILFRIGKETKNNFEIAYTASRYAIHLCHTVDLQTETGYEEYAQGTVITPDEKWDMATKTVVGNPAVWKLAEAVESIASQTPYRLRNWQDGIGFIEEQRGKPVTRSHRRR